MITPFNVPIWSQRDPRWSAQRLGIQGSKVNLGQSGCLITCIAMMNAGFDPGNWLLPNQVDDLFSLNPKGSNSEGYTDCNLVIWNAINRLLPNDATMGADYCASSDAPVEKIKHHLDITGLVILQVGFGGNPANMHFLLAVGHDGGDIIFNDPYYGDQNRFASRRYGTGNPVKDILAVHYFGDAIANEPVKPPVPVAARPTPQPLQPHQRQVRPGVNVFYRALPNVNGVVIREFLPNSIIDMRGYVHGDTVEGSDIWFIGADGAGYSFSGAFTDTDTIGLPDLTPQGPPTRAPEPEPAPVVEPEPVAAPLGPSESEWEETWLEDPTIPRKMVISGTYVVDFETEATVAPLAAGELVKPLAGYFQYHGEDYVRTQWAFDNDKWYGILLTDLKDYVAPPSRPGAPVDSIQGPISGLPGYDTDWLDDEEDTEPVLPTHPSTPMPDAAAWRKFIEVMVGILLTPLKLIGKIKGGR